MKRMLFVAGALLLFGGGLRAQQDTLEKIQNDTNKVFRAAGKEGPDKAAVAGLVDRYLDFAVDAKGTAEEFDALSGALNLAGYLGEPKFVEVYTECTEKLLESYVSDPRFAANVLGFQHPQKSVAAKAAEYLEWANRDTKDDSVKAACGFAITMQKWSTGKQGDADKKATLTALEGLKSKYGEKESPYGNKWGAMIDTEIENITIIGSPVREIVAKDLDGVEFKLSDYRGKVVLLDFWGYW